MTLGRFERFIWRLYLSAAAVGFLHALSQHCQFWVLLSTGFVSLYLVNLLTKAEFILHDIKHKMKAVEHFAVFIRDLIHKIRNEYFTEKIYIREVENKAVVITGCDSGFGTMLAQRLANMGFTVFAGCLDLSKEEAKKLAQNEKVNMLVLDVTKQEDIDSAADTVKTELTKSGLNLWSVVNNAGISISGEMDLLTTEAFRRIMDVNVVGAVAVTKAFLPLLREAGQGRVVNITSFAGGFPCYGFTPYCMSQRALVAFSDGLRIEMKKWNITVHTVEPAAYRASSLEDSSLKAQNTEVWQAAPKEAQDAYGRVYYKARTRATLAALRKSTRGEEKSREVVDDLVDAVSIQNPKTRYIPSLLVNILTRAVVFLPCDVLDWVGTHHLVDLTPHNAPKVHEQTRNAI